MVKTYLNFPAPTCVPVVKVGLGDCRRKVDNCGPKSQTTHLFVYRSFIPYCNLWSIVKEVYMIQDVVCDRVAKFPWKLWSFCSTYREC